METTIATALMDGAAVAAALRLADSLRIDLAGAPPVLLMAFASTQQPLGDVVASLQQAFPEAVVLGASTAGEFDEVQAAKSSVSAIAIAGDYVVHAGIGTGLRANAERAVATAIADLPAKVEDHPHRTVLLLLDPLAGNGEEVTLLAAAMLGADDTVRLAGGAAGDDLGMTQTFVGCREVASSDAVVIATIHSKRPLGIGVCHGQRPLSRPLRVSKASGAVVQEIEGRPAWDVWLEHTKEATQAEGLDPSTLREPQIIDYLLRYQGGLASGDDYKIRAPLSRGPDGSLAFACAVPEGAVIRITQSEPDHQVAAAREAARRAREQLGGAEPAGAVVFDCICRNLILGERFEDAIRGMSEELGGVPLAGFETYGEIALDVGDMSGFHNTTSVVLAFPK